MVCPIIVVMMLTNRSLAARVINSLRGLVQREGRSPAGCHLMMISVNVVDFWQMLRYSLYREFSQS